MISPPVGSLIASIPASNCYQAYPDLKLIAEIPPSIKSVLDPIWRRDILLGRPVSFYHFKNVILAAEGLVFDEHGSLIGVTRTYHSDAEVAEASGAVADAVSTRSFVEIDKGLLAKSRGATNYGHFILEMLPRAWLARNHLHLEDWPAIIHTGENDIQGISRQALLSAGFTEDLIVAVGRAPVFFHNLVFIDGLTYHTQYISPVVMQCIDAMTVNIPAANTEKIYAARGPATSRDFVNEPTAAVTLGSLGFQKVLTARMTFEQQVGLFKGAREVVGVSGAALANTVFCRPGTRVVAFMPQSAAEVLFWMIAQARRLHYTEVRCPEIGPQRGNLPWDRAIEISDKILSRLCRDLDAG